MGWTLTTYSLVGFGAAALSCLVAVLAWRYRDEPGARQLTILMFALMGWSVLYAVQLGFDTAESQLFWQRGALAVAGTVPTLWVLFVLEYAGKSDWLTAPRQLLLAIDPIGFAALSLTNQVHGLVWNGHQFLEAGPRVVYLALNVGYYVHIAIAYALVMGGIVLLVLVYARSSTLHRRQTATLLAAVSPPFLCHIAFTLRLDVGPLPVLDLTPFAFALTGVFIGLALFQFDLLQRAPIARRHVLEEMGDGLLVLDANGTIVDSNRVSRRALSPTPAVDVPIERVFPDAGSATTDILSSIDGRTIIENGDSGQRAYDVDCSTIDDHHGDVAGHVMALRDVTDRVQYEQRLEVAQRVLRHNLRNDVTVIKASAEQLAANGGNGSGDAVDRIMETTDELMELSEKTRTLVSQANGTRAETAPVDASQVVTTTVAAARESYPEATIADRIESGVWVPLPDAEFLEIALENLIENGIEHNDGEPAVTVALESDGDTVRIEVADDGPGIPDAEHEVLTSGSETPLQHGSGVGLWLVYWSVTTAGGSLGFETNDSGTTVTVTFSAVDPPSHQDREPTSRLPESSEQA